MESALTNVTYRHHPQPLSLNHRRSSKSIAFPKSASFPSFIPIKASFRDPNYQNPNHHLPKFPNPTPLSVLKTTVIAGVTVAALFLSRLTVKPETTGLVPVPPIPAFIAASSSESYTPEEEKTLENHLCSHPNDTKTLKTLMVIKIKTGKVQEAIGIVNQLINLEPEASEWQLLKNHLHFYGGDHESAKLGFEEILKNDPLQVEAYHGLVMIASATKSPNDLKNVEERVIAMCKKGKKKDEIRDFKLLLAQIRGIQEDYNAAIKIYQELVEEEPGDFRPYLCQGIMYTMLGKNDDAENMFGQYRRLVPKWHPHTGYFEDNVVATKVFAQKVESERAYAKS